MRRLAQRAALTSWRAVLEFVDDRGHRDAAQIAFFVLLSFIPLALLLVAAFGVFLGEDEVRDRVVRTALDALPLADERDQVRLRGVLRDALGAAGRLGPATVLLLIAGGSGVMSALRHAINQAWDIHDRPPLLRRKALDVALILGATVILAFSLSVAATRRAADVVDEESGLAAAVLEGLSEVLPFAFLVGVIAFLYRVLPMQRPRLRDVWPGALVASVLLLLVRSILELYFEHFADLGALYGSLGALMALLLFVYAAANVVVFGAEYASEWGRLPSDDEAVADELARGRAWVRRRLRR